VPGGSVAIMALSRSSFGARPVFMISVAFGDVFQSSLNWSCVLHEMPIGSVSIDFTFSAPIPAYLVEQVRAIPDTTIVDEDAT